MPLLPQDLQKFGWPTAMPMANPIPAPSSGLNPMADPGQVFAGLPPMAPTGAPGAVNALSKSQPKPFSGLPRSK
jgi:hypothetical protein